MPLPSAGFLPSVGLLAARDLARLVEVEEGVVLGGDAAAVLGLGDWANEREKP